MISDELNHLGEVGGAGPADLDALRAAGYTMLWQLAALSDEELRAVPGIDADGAWRIRRSLGILMDVGLTATRAPE